MENPFTNINAIKDIHYFYGRKALLQKVIEHIANSQSCSIVGEDKIGKISFLHLLWHPNEINELKVNLSNILFIYYDFQLDSVITPTIFWKYIFTKLNKKIIDDKDLKSMIEQLFSQQNISSTDVKILLNEIYNKDYKLVLLFDEFDCVSNKNKNLDLNFLNGLRSLATDPGIIYVTATKKRLDKLFPKQQNVSPFANIFYVIHLALLDHQDAIELIMQKKQPIEPTLEPESDYILKMAGRHPYVLQRLCFNVFEIKRQNTQQLLTENEKMKAFEASCKDLNPFFDNIWQDLREEEKQFIQKIINLDIPLSNTKEIEDLINQLENKGYIEIINGFARVFSKLFEEFAKNIKLQNNNIHTQRYSDSHNDFDSQENLEKKNKTNIKIRNKVFISYSHKDDKFVNRLKIHLTPLARKGIIDYWVDTKIKAGANWREEIKTALASTKVAVLLISADFLASKFISTFELPQLLQAAKNDGAKIIPLIVKPSWFNSEPELSKFLAINSPSKPLISMSENKREEILVRLVKEIELYMKD